MRALPFAFGVWLAAGLNAQEPTGRLEGLVLDPHTRPVPIARVQVEVDGEVVATTQSDAEGRFVVGRCPTGECLVRASTDAPDVGVLALEAGRAPGGFVHVRVMPARSVTGTVKAPDGTPIGGAWIAFGANGLEHQGGHSTSGANGEFAFAAVPIGAIALRVWAEGFAGAALEIDGDAPQRADVTLTHDDPDERAFALGDATAEQEAAAVLGVSAKAGDVSLVLPPALRRPVRADDGKWWLRGWPDQDRLVAHLCVPGATLEPPVLVTDQNARQRVRWFSVEDPSETLFEGRLAAIGGASAVGVEVIVEAAHAPWLQQRATSDEEGWFRLRSPVGLGRELRLRTVDPALALALTPGTSPPENGQLVCKQRRDHVHEFQLQPAAIVSATLLDVAGRPYGGARVEVAREIDQVVARVAGRQVWTERAANVLARGHTDRSGRIVLGHLPLAAGNEVALSVRGIGGLLVHAFTVQGGAQDLGTLRAQPGPRLEGRVLRADGTPLRGARIRIANGRIEDGFVQAWADREGRFTLGDLVPGPCTVSLLDNMLVHGVAALESDATGTIELLLP